MCEICHDLETLEYGIEKNMQQKYLSKIKKYIETVFYGDAYQIS